MASRLSTMLFGRVAPPGNLAKIDPKLPLNIKFAGHSDSKSLKDLYTGKLGTLSGTKLVPTKFGYARGFGSTYGLGTSDLFNTAITSNVDIRTYVFVYLINGSGGGGFGRLWQKGTGGTGCDVCFPSSSPVAGSILFAKKSTTNTTIYNVAYPRGTDGVMHIGILVTTTTSTRFFVDGVEQTISGFNPVATPDNVSADPYGLGNRADLARNFDGLIGDFHVIDRELSTQEVRDITQKFWIFFAPVNLSTYIPVGGGGTTYTFNVSGGITFSGAVALVKNRVFGVSGGFTLGGTAVPLGRVKVFGVSGGVTFGGTAPFVANHVYTFTVSGGVVFSGTANPIGKNRVFTVSGGVVFSGTAGMYFLPAGGGGGAGYQQFRNFVTGVDRSMRVS